MDDNIDTSYEAYLRRENALGSDSRAVVLGNWSKVSFGKAVLDMFDEVNLDDSTLDRLAEQSSRYPSKPLKLDGDEIRLLGVLPGEWNDQVQCTLETTKLSERPHYEALSYTWGNSRWERTIKLDNVGDFPVTDNAFLALRRLRFKDQTRVLWIDSVCINQGNLRERMQQVSIMANIYRLCTRCLVWLGEVASPTPGSIAARGHGLLQAGDDESLPALKALEDVFWYATPPWWERAWIIQEAVLAPRLVVHFGPVQTSWGSFCRDFLLLGTGEDRRVLAETSHTGRQDRGVSLREYPVKKTMQQSFQNLCTLRNIIHGDEKHLKLASIVPYIHESQCSDRRDRLYSILGLIDPQEASLIQPSYKISWAEVFARATFASIHAQENFRILWFVSVLFEPGLFALPSWAVDFHQLRDVDVTRLDTIGGRNPRKTGHDWSDASKMPSATARLDEDEEGQGRLVFAGTYFDEIVALKCLDYTTGQCRDAADSRLFDPLIAAVTHTRVRHAYHSVLQELHTHSDHGNDCAEGDFSDNKHLAYLTSAAAGQGYVLKGVQYPSMSIRDALDIAFTFWSEMAGLPRSDDEEFAGYGVHCFWDYAVKSATNPALAVTKAGFLALVPVTVLRGDTIVLPTGSKFPFLLRKDGHNKERYRFAGLAYIHGIMYGELSKQMRLGERFCEREWWLK